jgi:hypothetical protein
MSADGPGTLLFLDQLYRMVPLIRGGNMTHWHSAASAHDSQRNELLYKDIQHDDDVGYYGGWTLSGLAVLATIGAVWLVGM